MDSDEHALISDCESPRLLRLSELPEWARSGPAQVIHQIAAAGGGPVYAVPYSGDLTASPTVTRGAFRHGTFRTLFEVLSETELALLGRAMPVVRWAGTSRYCSRCGTPTEVPEAECVARCSECGHLQYPTLAPAMIVGVVRDGRLLLAQSPRFKGVFHSILAGFVEPGESVEECIHREVFEEAGIQVTNIRYFGSQSWPFPHSLMLGFTAEWAGGEIILDPEELVHADWYAPDNLPQVPSELSISGRIIRWFRETYGT